MASLTELKKIINGSAEIAVATLTKDGTAPDVRIVLGVYDGSDNWVIFMSNAKSKKVAEIAAHNQASFATPQFGKFDFARIRQATVEKIDPTPAQLKLYNDKYPETAQYAAQSTFFALSFKQADVTIDGVLSTVDITA